MAVRINLAPPGAIGNNYRMTVAELTGTELKVILKPSA